MREMASRASGVALKSLLDTLMACLQRLKRVKPARMHLQITGRVASYRGLGVRFVISKCIC